MNYRWSSASLWVLTCCRDAEGEGSKVDNDLSSFPKGSDGELATGKVDSSIENISNNIKQAHRMLGRNISSFYMSRLSSVWQLFSLFHQCGAWNQFYLISNYWLDLCQNAVLVLTLAEIDVFREDGLIFKMWSLKIDWEMYSRKMPPYLQDFTGINLNVHDWKIVWSILLNNNG